MAKVLVISERLLIAEALVSALVQRGFEPTSATFVSSAHFQDLATGIAHVALVEVDAQDTAPGIELIDRLRRIGVPVAVMSEEKEPRLLQQFIDAGASATIDPRSPFTDLVALFCRLMGNSLESKSHVTRNTTEINDSTEIDQCAVRPRQRTNFARLTPFAVLTSRERSVLAELMDGHRAELIAKNAFVSISTVRSQIRAILQKLGVNCQLAAVAMAREAGWQNQVTEPAHGESDLELA